MFTTSAAQQNFSGELPRLSDAATWWFRFTDLEPRFGSEPSFEKLTDGFKQDFGLTGLEATTLFVDDSSEQTLWSDDTSAVSDFADVVAEPVQYLPPAAHRASRAAKPGQTAPAKATVTELLPVEELHAYIRNRGFNFEPWQIATYVSAVRTKPFVILAGISGTGKTKLPRLIAEATGGICETVPVRPDWHDSSDLLGYIGLRGEFHPGHLLRFAKRAYENPEQQFFFVLDEMNIARVEYYLAEVLSRLEERSRNDSGRLQSEPFFGHLAGSVADEWASVGLPGNLCLIGSVNMDETTFGFSKKVLDRGFVIEFSTVDLSLVDEANVDAEPLLPWGSSIWEQSALSLPQHPLRDDQEVTRVIEALTVVNESLSNAQLQVGYRVRDEVAIFCLEAQKCPDQFATTTSGTVDPLDVAIAMKVLPRIQGSGVVIRKLLESLLDWASATENRTEDPGTGLSNGFPFCEERLQLMQRRLQDTGFANYWV
nr:AAA family ATPase [Arthrobacter sp. SF27]